MARINRLGYIGFSVSDVHAWQSLLRDLLGLMEVPLDSPGDALRYATDDLTHSVTLHQADVDTLAYIGWDAGSKDGLDALSSSLRSQGVAVEEGSPDLCETRGVAALIRFSGPDNVPLEAYHDLKTNDAVNSSQPPLVRGGFKTQDQGLGHVVLASGDPNAAVQWYAEKLGFAVSDRIHWDEAKATFLNCNARHHSLAILNCAFGMQPGAFNHLLLEMNQMDDVGLAYDRVTEAGVPLALSIGKHSNDHMTSFYLVNPSGSAIEIGWGGLEIDESWEEKFFDTPKIWGHNPGDASSQSV